MRVLDPGHVYEIDAVDGDEPQRIVFVKRFRGAANHGGTINQELLRVLIDRLGLLNDERHSVLTDQIIHHLQMALVLHEARALYRKVEKGELDVMTVATCPKDGHFIFQLREMRDAD